MKPMKEIKIVAQLYDFYSCLLTKKQNDYLIDCYFNDFSYSEMSSKYNVSRPAIHSSISNSIKELYAFETRLKLLEKHLKRIKLYDNINNMNLKSKLIKLEFEK